MKIHEAHDLLNQMVDDKKFEQAAECQSNIDELRAQHKNIQEEIDMRLNPSCGGPDDEDVLRTMASETEKVSYNLLILLYNIF